MFKSIFAKYFTVMSVIIIVSFLATVCLQLIFSTQYWINDKKELLVNTNSDFASLAAENARPIANGYDLSAIKYDMDIISKTIDAYIFVAQNNGEIALCSENAYSSLFQNNISKDFLTSIGNNEYWEVGKLNGLFSKQYYTAGKPLATSDGVIIGYVFTSASAEGLGQYLRENLQMFFLSAIGVLAFSFIVIYMLTYTMVRPLRQMANATRRFAMGDFSARITAKGRDEVAELATALNSMAASLSSVESMRRSFIANVSHELKTPMTTISGFIDGILDGTISTDKQEHYLNIVSTEIKRLSRLVKSMLDLSRIDNGELHINMSKFDLTEQTCNVLLSFEQRITDKRVEVKGLEDSLPVIEVNADRDLISQVIYNLIDNATKFVDEGGTLTLRLYQLNNRVYFSIRNTGAGMPANEMPHIFERFYKSDKSRSLDKNGMGLGLYIVKTIITLHKGEIVVRSAEGEFCEFEFWLPGTGYMK